MTHSANSQRTQVGRVYIITEKFWEGEESFWDYTLSLSEEEYEVKEFFVKLGYTTQYSYKKREAANQVGNPRVIETIILTEPIYYWKSYETAISKAFEKRKVRGEWYSMTATQLRRLEEEFYYDWEELGNIDCFEQEDINRVLKAAEFYNHERRPAELEYMKSIGIA